MAFALYTYEHKMRLLPEYKWTGNFPVRSVYSVLVCVSARVAKQNNSQGANGSGIGCMSCWCSVFASAVVFYVDHRFFRVRWR
jgi:hypothetical protein